MLRAPCALLAATHSPLRVAQAHCWTLVYPTEASLNAIGVFVTAEVALDPAHLRAPVFVWACPEDPTADYAITEAWCRAVPACSLEAVTPGTGCCRSGAAAGARAELAAYELWLSCDE